FGLGVGVMATLLGVGEVVLEQARAPQLTGGGQWVVSGTSGPVTSARFVIARIHRAWAAQQPTTADQQPTTTGQQPTTADQQPTTADQQPTTNDCIASPRLRADLFLIRNGATVPVRARAGIPSLERALGDPETSGLGSWADTNADRRWVTPDAADVLRGMDRFHAVPDVPARMSSWAEWLYFKGRSGDLQFYATFLFGPAGPDGRRRAGVRLQMDRGGRITSYSANDSIDEAELLRAGPDVTIGRSRVRLDGLRYRIVLDLPGASGEIDIAGVAGRSLPPYTLRGAGGWISGYTIPVMSGSLSGWIATDRTRTTLAGTGYHDHNWGFWEGVSWRWGQVQYGDLAIVYGRVFPPADAADATRVPGVIVALGPGGPIGYSTRVSIDETDDPATGQPRRINVRGRGESLDLQMQIQVEDAIVNRGGALAAGPDFLQLRGRYRVTGRAGGQAVDFEASGAAETFRGGAPPPTRQ
ncbi:MAG TPA: hypothetical protein VF219_05185, partial [Vicinamibacterales bacterium]